MTDLEEALQSARGLVAKLERAIKDGIERSEAGTPACAGQTHLMVARAWLRAQAVRRPHFPGGIFADPAWELLLDLYANQKLGRRISVSSACIASNVPATTALRWIDLLVSEDLVMRSKDPADGRRVFLLLTDRGQRALEATFDDAMASDQQLGLGRLQLIK